MIQAFWRNSRYAKSVQVMMDIQVAVGNPMILSHHPRIAALFLQPKQDWDDQSDEHHHCYQQQVMHNHGKHQSEDHQYRYTNPFVRWQAITNSWGNILFWHPSGTFCQLWFPGLRPSQGTQNKLFDKLLLGANIRCIHRQLQKKYAHVQLTGGDNKKAFLTIFNEAIWGVMPPSPQNWLVGQTQVAVTPPKHKAHLPPTHACHHYTIRTLSTRHVKTILHMEITICFLTIYMPRPTLHHCTHGMPLILPPLPTTSMTPIIGKATRKNANQLWSSPKLFIWVAQYCEFGIT